jgi:hypothetical protein
MFKCSKKWIAKHHYHIAIFAHSERNYFLSSTHYKRENLKIQVSRLALFGKPQFTIVNEDFTKIA